MADHGDIPSFRALMDQHLAGSRGKTILTVDEMAALVHQELSADLAVLRAVLEREATSDPGYTVSPMNRQRARRLAAAGLLHRIHQDTYRSTGTTIVPVGATLAPGETLPWARGYVRSECGHSIAASEWKAGFRVCETGCSVFKAGESAQILDRDRDPDRYATATVLAGPAAKFTWTGNVTDTELAYLVRYDNGSVGPVRAYDVLKPRQ